MKLNIRLIHQDCCSTSTDLHLTRTNFSLIYCFHLLNAPILNSQTKRLLTLNPNQTSFDSLLLPQTRRKPKQTQTRYKHKQGTKIGTNTSKVQLLTKYTRDNRIEIDSLMDNRIITSK